MTEKPTTIHKAFGLEDKFYIGENKTAQDKTISFELIGLIAYLSSLPKNWKINAGDIIRTGCGRNKAYRLLNELLELGFLQKIETRNDDGTFKSVAYSFYALRQENIEYKGYNPFPQNQDTDNQDTDNQLLQSKEVKKEKNTSRVREASKRKSNTELIQAYETHFGLGITSIVSDTLHLWLEDYSLEDIIGALKETGKQGVRSIKYSLAILERWAIEGRGSSSAAQKADPPQLQGDAYQFYDTSQFPDTPPEERARQAKIFAANNPFGVK